MLRRAVATFVLASSLSSLRSRNIAAARRKLDYALTSNLKNLDFILAYDAMLMIQEERPYEARHRLHECLAHLPVEKNADEQYIERFCQYWLSAYDGHSRTDLIRDASKLDTRRTIRTFLRFPSA
jgi:hypothetical protein